MTAIQFFKFRELILFCGIFLFACSSDEPEAVPAPGPGTPAGTSTVEELDDLSDHFEFLSAKEISGEIPAAPAGNSNLKISFKDTLYMMASARIPIKFLHDAGTNVAGVYIQVHNTAGNPLYATYHYDVPELAESAESDTVSVIFVAFDPTGLELPLSVPVTISPYGKNGQPLDEIEEIFTVEESNESSNTSGRSEADPCPFTSASEFDSWNWKYSVIEVDGSIEFYIAQGEMATYGQTVNGCCNEAAGVSTGCAVGQVPNANLFFPTYYRIELELLAFLENGTFRRTTVEASANPLTDESNFCGDVGKVKASIHEIDYRGFWTLDPNTENLQLQTTESTAEGGLGG